MASPAPACKAALAEATRLYPNRSRASDGIMGDLRHQSTPSDHNDGNAWDLTHDPANGCDAHELVRAAVARRDPRIKYAISNRQIWSALYAEKGWRPYTGSNPHVAHAHVSIVWRARDDTAPWFPQMPATITTHPSITDWLGAFMFKDDNDRLAFQVIYAYTTLLGRPLNDEEGLSTLAWWMDEIKLKGYAAVWEAIANSGEAVARR